MNDSAIVTLSQILEIAFICTSIAAALVLWSEWRKRRRAREKERQAPIPDSLEILRAMAAREQAARRDAGKAD